MSKNVKKKDTKFKKGMSGNPAGRPKGSKNKTTEIKAAIEADMVDAIQSDYMDILKKTISLAKSGDTTCIKILMERIWPVHKQNKAEDKNSGGINIIIKGLEVEDPKVIEGEVVDG